MLNIHFWIKIQSTLWQKVILTHLSAYPCRTPSETLKIDIFNWGRHNQCNKNHLVAHKMHWFTRWNGLEDHTQGFRQHLNGRFYVCKICPKRSTFLMWSPLPMSYIQNSRSRCKHTSPFWTLTETFQCQVQPSCQMTKWYN